MLQQLKQKDIDAIQQVLEKLAIKKTWKINVAGKKVKVVRSATNEYAVYNDGHYITTDENWQQAFELVKALLNYA
jgi:intein-encoded DNA endonuclease-like protein